MIPVIKLWQLEGGVGMSMQPCMDGGAVDVINDFLGDVLDHIEKDMTLTECKVSIGMLIE